MYELNTRTNGIKILDDPSFPCIYTFMNQSMKTVTKRSGLFLCNGPPVWINEQKDTALISEDLDEAEKRAG